MPKEQKPKSPSSGVNPALPASVEQSYRQKCKDIKKRITEIENSNDLLTARIQRARRAIQRMRLERAFLLQQLERRTDPRVDDSEGSPSPPPTPGGKPLRVKRARKDPPPMDSPMRQRSPSPPREHDYSFVNQSFTMSVGQADSPGPYPGPVRSQKSGGKPRAPKSGPKRPPNAYMIFCEKERDAVRERESHNEGFDMHKALAQAWRDLKPEGQKPYFEEYDRNRNRYLEKVQEVKQSTGDPHHNHHNNNGNNNNNNNNHGSSYNNGGSGGGGGAFALGQGQPGRAMSAASSAAPPSNYDPAASPAPGSVMDDAEDAQDVLGASQGEGFTAVNR